MKKIIALLLVLVMVVGIVACGETPAETTPSASTPAETTPAETNPEQTTQNETTPEETTLETTTTTTPIVDDPSVSGTFDPSNIVFSFAALSDTHVDGISTTPGQKFMSALTQLKAQAAIDDPDGIDAVFIAGDMINDAYKSATNYAPQTSAFKSIYETVFDPKEVSLVYTPGNHDTFNEWTAMTAIEAKNISKVLGDDYFLTDIDKEMLEAEECRHCVVNGYHVLTIPPCGRSPVIYMPDALTWLDNTLAEITAENPNQFVFVLTHPMIYQTVYGSDLGTYWYTEALTPILSKYPQVVTFSGHLHFPLNDPRSVMQTEFTSFGCGSVRYMAIESGNYENMAGSPTMANKDEFSQGLLVQIDKNGNLRATRMDFYHNETIDEPWEISHPTTDGAHLTKYSWERGSEENNTAPVMSDEMTITEGAAVGNAKQVFLTFKAAQDDEFAHDYVISFKANGRDVTKNILADFYRHSKITDMQTEWTQLLGNLPAGTYTVNVVAHDSWGAASNIASKTFTVTAGGGTTPDDGGVYVDLDFKNGEIIDTKGNVKVTKNTGSVVKKAVKFVGKEYTVDAFTSTKGKYAVLEFTQLKANDMQTFMAKGFSVEAFYVIAGKTGAVQGVVCGTQTGGWGLAHKATGNPYFIVGDTTGGYVEADASTPAASTSLVHVVGVYDLAAGKVRIYVNGSLDGTGTILSDYKIGGVPTQFCLGDDIKSPNAAGDFPTSDFTLVDAKLYSKALSDAEVQTAFSDAMASLK